ncbi:MAG: glycosyltransferase, partial [Allobranchiibius sp.]
MTYLQAESVATESVASDRAFVTALLVVRSDDCGDTAAGVLSGLLDATSAALVAQTRRPDRLVVVDATAGRMMRDYLDGREDLRASYPQVSVVVLPCNTPFAAIVDLAVDALPETGEDLVIPRRSAQRAGRRPVRSRDSTRWLWLLHEDSTPDATALAELTAATSVSPRVGIAGCKVVDVADPRTLLDIGTEVTRSGRHAFGSRAAEPDQGQHDDRRDVLSVSSAGMLVRQDTYNELGGFDPAFDGDGDGLDLGWRAHLIGHSVVIVPGARVRRVASHSGVDARTRRRHRQVALARASLSGMAVLALWTTLSSLVLGFCLVLAKRPRRAGAEFIQATAALGMPRILGARRRFFRRATTRRRNLSGLFVPAASAARAEFDSLHDAVIAGTHSYQGAGAVGSCAEPTFNETGPVEADAEELRAPRGPVARSLFGPAGLVVFLLTIASAVLWRRQLIAGGFGASGFGLSGGQLLPFETDATGLWATYRDAWVGPGLGHPSSVAPYLAVLAPLVWVVGLLPWVQQSAAGGVTIAWLMLAAMPLSGLVAYRAGRAVTAARWPRIAVALFWGTLPSLTTAIAQGRLGLVVAHIVLPFAVAGLLMTARRGTGTALTFATVLSLAVVGAFSPVLLVGSSIVALVGVVLAPGLARLRQLTLLVLPWLLLAPWTREVLTGDHRLALAGPGALDPTRGILARPWELALLHPGGPGSYAVLASIPVVVLGLLGLLRGGLGRAGGALIA